MWFEHRKTAAKPFLARWRDAAGKVQTRTFLTAKDRDTFKRAFEKKLDEQAKAFAHLNLFIEAVTPLITRQKSRAERAKELGISLPTLARREQRARINLELDKL